MERTKTKKTYLYPVNVEPHKEGGYHAKCPILQGAWADGETIEEAVDSLRDAIKLILKYREDRERKRIYIPNIPQQKAKILQELHIAVTV